MLLITHILIALASLVLATLAVMSPSQTKLRGSYGLIALTLASGTVLVVTTGANLLHSCLTGLVYCATVLALALAAQRRLHAV